MLFPKCEHCEEPIEGAHICHLQTYIDGGIRKLGKMLAAHAAFENWNALRATSRLRRI